MTDKPDFVLNFDRPKRTEIKHIGNNWWLYERRSEYDPELKRSRKISGRCLGKITPEGLVESMPRDKNHLPAVNTVQPRCEDHGEVGSVLFALPRQVSLRERLKKHFPGIWKKIYVIANLRTFYQPQLNQLEINYETSFWSHIFPNIPFSAHSITDFLNDLGKRRGQIRKFMIEDVECNSKFILFDGHRVISTSKTMEYAEFEDDFQQRQKPQINVVYVHSLSEDSTGAPVYYKQYIGSMPDEAAFSDILKECSIKDQDYTIIGDKGFSSEGGFDLTEEYNLKFIMPLERDNRFIKDNIPTSPNGYDEAFIYQKNTVLYKIFKNDGFNVILYYNKLYHADEVNKEIINIEKINEINKRKREIELDRRMKNKGKLNDDEFNMLKNKSLIEVFKENPAMGTLTIRTNRTDLEPQKIYALYKQREKIEQYFRIYSSSLNFDASYMINKNFEEALLFLNHISSIIGVSFIDEICSLGENKNISLAELRFLLTKIDANKIENEWCIAPVKKAVQKRLGKLGLSFEKDVFDQFLQEVIPSLQE